MVDVVAPRDAGSHVEMMRTTLAIADDDLYILGFANRSGHWHVMKDFGGLPEPLTKLTIEHSYGDLVGSFQNLHTVPLGRESEHLQTTTAPWPKHNSNCRLPSLRS